MSKIHVLLPAYNERPALSKLIPQINNALRSNYSVIVVDDGSDDGTAILCKEYSNQYPVKCLLHEVNKGFGAAIQTGLKYVLDNSSDMDMLVVMDADNTHSPEYIKCMLEKTDTSDIIIASRYKRNGGQIGVNMLRKFLSFSASRLFTILFDIKGVRDYTCGFRMYKLKVIKDYVEKNKRLPVSEKGFPATVEMLLNLDLSGARCDEIPLVLRYDFKEGRSSMKIIKTILKYLKLIFKMKYQRENSKNFNHPPCIPFKVLHIINIPWYSGLAGYAVDMAKYMEELGEDIVFAVVGNSPLYDKLKGSYEVLPLPGRDIFNSMKGLLKIWKVRNEIKLIFAHSGSSCFMGCVLALFKDIKVIRVRTEKGAIKRNIFNIIIHRSVNTIVVPSELIMNDYLEFGIRKNKLILLPPVVDTEMFKFSPLPESMNMAIIGRLTGVKGHRALIESLPAVMKEVKDIKVLIAGSDKGNQWPKLKSYAKALNVDKQIRYMGFLTDEEIANVIKNSRLGIIPSLWSEAVSRVALEFMASGRPVIASSVGILSEIIKPGINGFIIEPGNSRQLSSSILKILKDTEYNIKMGKNAEELMENSFSPEVYKKNLKSLMGKLYT